MNQTDLKPLKVDLTKLKTVRSYAEMIKKTVAWVYRLGERGEIDIIEIDGVKFVKVENR